jgi:hypothetical protein
MRYYVDIDNTICLTEGNDYENSVPSAEAISKINRLFDEGNVVIYWTARGGTSGRDLYTFTLRQLVNWGCKFNSLSCDKPSFDVIIDDRAKNIDDI